MDKCKTCGAGREEIRKFSHRATDASGRVYVAVQGEPSISRRYPCPEACTCVPEHFSMVEHRAASRSFFAGPVTALARKHKAELVAMIAESIERGAKIAEVKHPEWFPRERANNITIGVLGWIEGLETGEGASDE